MKVKFVIFPHNEVLDLVRCFAFDINRAIVGKILLNSERKIRYLLSSIIIIIIRGQKSK